MQVADELPERGFPERPLLGLVDGPFFIRTASEGKPFPLPTFYLDFRRLVRREADDRLVAKIISGLAEVAQHPVPDHEERVFFPALDVALLVPLGLALLAVA